MTDSLTAELHNRQQAWALFKSLVFPFLQRVLQGGSVWVLTITRRKRTSKQNRRYWGRGVLAQIAEQATVNGRLYSAEVWHELMKKKFIGLVELPDGSVIGKSSTGNTCAFLYARTAIRAATTASTASATSGTC